jgi:hypothetical protein
MTERRRKHQPRDPLIQEQLAIRRKLKAEYKQLRQFVLWEERLFENAILTDQQKTDVWIAVARATGILSQTDE